MFWQAQVNLSSMAVKLIHHDEPFIEDTQVPILRCLRLARKVLNGAVEADSVREDSPAATWPPQLTFETAFGRSSAWHAWLCAPGSEAEWMQKFNRRSKSEEK